MKHSIFENLIHNLNRETNTGFDLTKSITENKKSVQPLETDPYEPPIEPNNGDWAIEESYNGRYLHKKYKFNSTKKMLYFIIESLKFAEKINHDPEITILSKEIEVKLTTHDIGDISFLDVKMSKFMTETFEDISYIG